jgi:hypothetical protein
MVMRRHVLLLPPIILRCPICWCYGQLLVLLRQCYVVLMLQLLLLLLRPSGPRRPACACHHRQFELAWTARLLLAAAFGRCDNAQQIPG